MKIVIGSDHGGYELKNELIEFLKNEKYAVEDMGTHSKDSCDYPMIGFEVAKAVSSGKADKGVLICKTGVGMAIIANKLRNVRSAVASTISQAKTSRQHNDTNVLSLAAKYINFDKAKKIVDTWLKTEAESGRHARRVNEIQKLERP